MKPISTALIGFGFSARTFHLPFLQALPEFSVCAASTRRREFLPLLEEGVSHYEDADTLLEQSDARLVVITSTNESHYPLARRALEQGRDVVIDKPFVCSVAEGESLLELAERKGRLLSVYQNRRWDGDFLTLKALIDSGRVGQVRRFESHFDRFRPEVQPRWREQKGPGTGIWFDLGPHLLDQALQLFGLPDSLTAQLRALREGSQVTDYFHVQLHYPEHEVILHSDPFCAAPNLRFQLDGTHGSFRKSGLDPQEDRLRAGATPDVEHWGMEDRADWGRLYTAEGSDVVETLCGGYQHYYRRIADALLNGGVNPVTPQQALDVMRLLELAEASSEQGRTLPL